MEERKDSCGTGEDAKEKRRTSGRKAGKRMKSFREAMGEFLKCHVEDEGQSRMLEEMGFEPTYLNLINLSSVKKADLT